MRQKAFYCMQGDRANGSSIKAVCPAFQCSPNTITKAIRELSNKAVPPNGRQRMPDGGAKRKNATRPNHPNETCLAPTTERLHGWIISIAVLTKILWLAMNLFVTKQLFCRKHYYDIFDVFFNYAICSTIVIYTTIRILLLLQIKLGLRIEIIKR